MGRLSFICFKAYHLDISKNSNLRKPDMPTVSNISPRSISAPAFTAKFWFCGSDNSLSETCCIRDIIRFLPIYIIWEIVIFFKSGCANQPTKSFMSNRRFRRNSVYRTQFSRVSPSTLSNSAVLLVTNVMPRDLARPAMNKS